MKIFSFELSLQGQQVGDFKADSVVLLNEYFKTCWFFYFDK